LRRLIGGSAIVELVILSWSIIELAIDEKERQKATKKYRY
jgi:hypothetical protein